MAFTVRNSEQSIPISNASLMQELKLNLARHIGEILSDICS